MACVRRPGKIGPGMAEYKQLWRVGRCFRGAKSLLPERPVFHRMDAAMRGHIAFSFLEPLLKTERQSRLQAAGIEPEWQDVIQDLRQLRKSVVEVQDKRLAVRTQAVGKVADNLHSVGVLLPQSVR